MIAQPKSRPSMGAIWIWYKRSGSTVLRNMLVERYSYIVWAIAKRMAGILPRSVDVRDLVSTGVIGLMDAIEKFSPDHNVKFENYAPSRIRGSILDCSRKQDWVPRLVRQNASRYHATHRKLKDELGRIPSNLELAAKMGISTQKVSKLEQDADIRNIHQLNEEGRKEDDEDNFRGASAPIDRKSEALFEHVCTVDLLEDLLRRLKSQERAVIEMRFYQGLTMREIGLALCVSESRICQRFAKIIQKMRSHLALVS